MKTSIKKIVAVTLIMAMLVPMLPRRANAIPVVVVADTSPTSIMRTIDSEMDRLKNYVLDNLANVFAKQILHMITASIVNWINSGFSGSPAFISNPGGFWLDTADQISGDFLSASSTSPLRALCEPFSINIRTSLAFGQAGYYDRYTCTFGKIYENVKDLPNNVSVNGRSMEGFMKGDFTQGGWPAFIEMTTVPQNNPTGAYMKARGELVAEISAKKAQVNLDLNLGNGFMSWESCDDVATDVDTSSDEYMTGMDLLNSGEDAIDGMTSNTDSSTSYTRYENGTNGLTKKNCSVETPGSVISGTLMKGLNSPATELELANSINTVVSALVTKMISMMLESGLGALSGGGSGSSHGPSYTEQLINEALSTTTSPNLKMWGGKGNSSVGNLNIIQSNYNKAQALLVGLKAQFIQARECFQTKIANNDTSMSNKNTAQQNINDINSFIEIKLDPYLDDINMLKDKYDAQANSIDFSTAQGTTSITDQASSYVNTLRDGTIFKEDAVNDSEKDLNNATVFYNTWSFKATSALSACNAM